MVELVDTLVLGTSAYGVGVRLPLAAHLQTESMVSEESNNNNHDAYGLGKFYFSISVPLN